MLQIKKQISRLYASNIAFNLSLTGAWVAILAARGYSLVEIGLAETVFHITSILFEIPSGVLADVFGRKRMLVVSVIMGMISSLIMIFSFNLPLLCLSLAFRALNYNFMSGSDTALAYDSLKLAGQEERFDKYESNQLIIYRLCSGLSTLCAGAALFIGYRAAYTTDLVMGAVQLAILSGLEEVYPGGRKPENTRQAGKELLRLFRESLLFLKEAKKAIGLMFANSLVGAADILLLFFLQAKLPEKGIPQWALGPALLFLQLGGVLGARVVLKLSRFSYQAIFALSLLLVLGGVLMEHSSLYVLAALGGFLAAVGDDALQVRTNVLLQDMFPSEQRATLTSLESFTFSAVMVVLSPLAGLFFSGW